MKTTFRIAPLALTLCAILSLSACKSATEREREKALDSVTGTANQEAVVEMLHRDHLILIPEVKAKSDSFIQVYRSGTMTREAAAKAFRIWMEEWVKAHPEKAKQAREMGAAIGARPVSSPRAPATPAVPRNDPGH